MTTPARLLGLVALLSWLGLSAATAAGGPSKDILSGAWRLDMDRDERPWLTFYDTSRKTVFRFGCGTHYELDAVYPGEAPKQDHTGATITIGNGKTQMDFAGFTYAAPENFPPDTSWFNQADLAHPELTDDIWHALEDQFLDLLASGQPLTVSAEGKSYSLPPTHASRWRARFKKVC
ncbi:hypothetical protein [Bradyrhizobium guangzhouense]|uniref:hypothetical protein n=1 Tax=Bradyrhizobium guangzhouense TaxID=1325095 RepID=UPI001009CA37|nr:hypothetical protein [Bradyrhizobium guangzhouense]RXH07484.1 hypothetical protein EAS54_37655 [Bradyrhizobium guangzhouense]